MPEPHRDFAQTRNVPSDLMVWHELLTPLMLGVVTGHFECYASNPVIRRLFGCSTADSMGNSRFF